jgi:Lipase (class 3)
MRILPRVSGWALTAIAGLVSSVACDAPDAPFESSRATSNLAGNQFTFRAGAEQSGAISRENAYWSAFLAQVSYSEKDEILRTLAGVGLDTNKPGYEFHFFNVPETDTEAFYLATPSAAFVALRGTSTLRDISTDVNIGPELGFAPGAKVHRGFAAQVDNLWVEGKLGSFLKARHSGKPSEKRLYLTGHSMGGALAVLLGHAALFAGCRALPNWRNQGPNSWSGACRNSYIPIEGIYTFGQPFVGDAAFQTQLAGRFAETKTSYVRVVNADDGVPTIPENIGFSHIERNRLGQYATLTLSRAGKLLVGSYPRGADDTDSSLPKETCGDRGIRDHALGTYLTKLFSIANGTPWRATEACQ